MNKLFIYLLIVLLLNCTITISYVYGETDYCEVLELSLKFYKANRAGKLVANDYPSWRGDSTLGDSYNGQKNNAGDGNLSGGYFDAGDHVKFGFPMAFTMTVLGWSYIEYQSNVESCGLANIYLETLKWGYDYLIACHISDNEFVGQVGDGDIDHQFWGPPEMMPSSIQRPVFTLTTSAPGTDLAMEAASALSTCSIIYKTSNPSYAATCLSHAKKLYEFGYNYRGFYSTSIPQAYTFYKSYSYDDELVWGALWLYRATGTQSYLDAAKSGYKNVQYQNNFDWDSKALGSQLLMFQVTNDTTYKSDIENNLNQWLTGTFTPGGLAFYQEWGPNRYSMLVSFIAKLYKGDEKYNTFASKQLDYVLGKNPKSQSFVVGYGPNHPINPHHRSSHHSTIFDITIPVNNVYILYGALVGGPSKNDVYVDDRQDFKANEVALDYNSGFVGVLSAFSKGSVVVPTTNPSSNSESSNFELSSSISLSNSISLLSLFLITITIKLLF